MSKRKYDRALLDETFARDNASHDETKELPTRLNGRCRIPFKCACGTPNIRVFRKMVDHGGARCEPCTKHNAKLKRKATCLENHGVAKPYQSAEVREKAKATWIENHGVENPMQSSEILERSQKNALKRKDFTTPSGEVWSLQGYEPLVAPKLIDEYGEDDITPDLKQVPRIWWTDSKGVRHRYSCDFYVKSHKIIVEVKSTYTVVVGAEKIEATRKAANALGYGYRLIVLDKKGVWTRDEISPPVIHSEV